MVNSNKLKGAYTSLGYTQEDVAKQLNISHNSFCMKVNNKSEFKANEILKLCLLLNISNTNEIFFVNDVANKGTL